MAKPLENLKKIKHEAIQDLIENGLLSSTRIYVGMSTCEIAAGSKEVWNTFENEIKEKGIKDVILNQPLKFYRRARFHLSMLMLTAEKQRKSYTSILLRIRLNPESEAIT